MWTDKFAFYVVKIIIRFVCRSITFCNVIVSKILRASKAFKHIRTFMQAVWLTMKRWPLIRMYHYEYTMNFVTIIMPFHPYFAQHRQDHSQGCVYPLHRFPIYRIKLKSYTVPPEYYYHDISMSNLASRPKRFQSHEPVLEVPQYYQDAWHTVEWVENFNHRFRACGVYDGYVGYEWIIYIIPHFRIDIIYLSMLESRLIHVGEIGPCWYYHSCCSQYEPLRQTNLLNLIKPLWETKYKKKVKLPRRTPGIFLLSSIYAYNGDKAKNIIRQILCISTHSVDSMPFLGDLPLR